MPNRAKSQARTQAGKFAPETHNRVQLSQETWVSLRKIAETNLRRFSSDSVRQFLDPDDVVISTLLKIYSPEQDINTEDFCKLFRRVSRNHIVDETRKIHGRRRNPDGKSSSPIRVFISSDKFPSFLEASDDATDAEISADAEHIAVEATVDEFRKEMVTILSAAQAGRYSDDQRLYAACEAKLNAFVNQFNMQDLPNQIQSVNRSVLTSLYRRARSEGGLTAIAKKWPQVSSGFKDDLHKLIPSDSQVNSLMTVLHRHPDFTSAVLRTIAEIAIHRPPHG